MAKAFSGKKPQHFGNTIRVFLNYLGRHKFMLGLVGVLTAVSALANLLGTYMIKPVVNGILETGSIPGLVRGVALTAASTRWVRFLPRLHPDHGARRAEGLA